MLSKKSSDINLEHALKEGALKISEILIQYMSNPKKFAAFVNAPPAKKPAHSVKRVNKVINFYF